MRKKDRKIGRKKVPQIEGRKGRDWKPFRVKVPGLGVLTIFAESPGKAINVGRRLRGLARLLADLAMLRSMLEAPENHNKPGLSIFFDRESRLQLAGPGAYEPLLASACEAQWPHLKPQKGRDNGHEKTA